MADPVLPVEAPTRRPRRGGIRTVADFRENSRIGLGGSPVFVSPGCNFTVGSVELCYPSPMGDQAEKTRQGIETLAAAVGAFGGYYGVECWLDGEDYDAAARAGLEAGEDRLIEAALNTYLTGLASSGAPADFVEAIATAEENADDTYIGAPIILMNRGDAVRAAAALALSYDREGNLWTPNGTPVAASGRITAGNVSIIGALTIEHTGIYVNGAPILVNNKEFAIAERVYAALVDCNFAARYVVTPTP